MGGSLIEVSIYMRDYIFFEDLDKIWSQFAVDLIEDPLYTFPNQPIWVTEVHLVHLTSIHSYLNIWYFWVVSTTIWVSIASDRRERKKIGGKSLGITGVNLDSGGHYHPASSGDPRLPIWPTSLCIQTQDHGLEAGCLRFLKTKTWKWKRIMGQTS